MTKLPDFSLLAKSIVVGAIYEHYKGQRYQIIGVARHSESLEEMIVYRQLYEKEEIWVRPLVMFVEKVNIEDVVLPRFKRIETSL